VQAISSAAHFFLDRDGGLLVAVMSDFGRCVSSTAVKSLLNGRAGYRPRDDDADPAITASWGTFAIAMRTLIQHKSAEAGKTHRRSPASTNVTAANGSIGQACAVPTS